MDEKQMMEMIDTIEKMKARGAFKNYIEYIEFPYYKNLIPKTRMNFKFPMTVLIGKNGSGKSSTLHALFGAPKGYTCSDFWFSTDVDPILESGDRNRYFYGYFEKQGSEIKEVMKLRMRRGSETKKEDFDYWETSRPLKKDGMLKSNRNTPVIKKVIYLDFRAEVSAFDKIYHFSKDELEERKNLLRDRAKYLKRLFDGNAMRFPGTQDEKMGKMKKLKKETINKIGYILNKEYSEILVADHKLYRILGTSVYMKTQFQTGYSEANAGSGEIAVVQLVRRVEEAPDYSLILLDEPEVSLHPGAQENLKKYLLESIKQKKLQVIISSHSPSIIDGLPNSALKLFKTNDSGKFYVEENINYQEAFYDIENKVSDKKAIYCEDFAAKEIINKVLTINGKDQYFDVIYHSGGVTSLINHYITPLILNHNYAEKTFVMLDGDQDNEFKLETSNLTRQQSEDANYLAKKVECAYGMKLDVYPDGGSNGGRDDQKCEDYLKYLMFYEKNVFYLPRKMIPEEIILKSKYVESRYRNILNKYEIINSKNAKEVVAEISESDFGDSIHINATIIVLTNKWSQEESELKNEIVNMLNVMFEK